MIVKQFGNVVQGFANLLLQGLASDERDVGLHLAPEGPATLHWGCVAVKVLQTKSYNSQLVIPSGHSHYCKS